MPLLMCPNCNQSMSALMRKDVEFDMCPECRGVWLDRGELEKLMDAARSEAVDRTRSGSFDDERGMRNHDRRDRFDRRRERKRGFDLFDIFD